MENTYIISDNSDWIQKITKQLELPNNQVLFYQEWREDFLFDEWVNINIKPDISYLIIPIELGSNRYNSFEGLRLAMHIRLMKSHIRYLPIIFISNREEWQIRQMLRDNLDKNHLDYLIGTKGTDFLKPNICEIKAVLKNIKPLGEEEYKAQFYDHIHLLPLEEDGGKHSLANIWGALRLNEILNLNAINDKNLTNRTKELYFKYLRAFHEESKGSFKDLQPLQCNGKRILLIDDEADKGWEDVLKAIFKGADFHSIDFKNKPFEDAEQEAIGKSISEDWDLILLDLRLNPSEEDTGDKLIKTEEYSGARILKAIKKHNAGIQVIILTASNKAWNMKKLLDLGADGYYIKESPEYNFPSTFTKENYSNFKDEVDRCFKLSFLREVALIHKSCVDVMTNSGFHNRSKASLEIAFELLKKSADAPKYLNLAFLTYFQILEDYANQKEIFEYNSNAETGKCIVKKNGETIIVIQSGKAERDCMLTFQKGKDIGGKYNFYKKQDGKYLKNDYDALGKISFILAFKFNKDDDYLKKWGKLNHLRNTKAGHGGNGGFVTVSEIKELLEIVVLFLTNQ